MKRALQTRERSGRSQTSVKKTWKRLKKYGGDPNSVAALLDLAKWNLVETEKKTFEELDQD